MSLGARATKRGAKVGKEGKVTEKTKPDKPIKEKVKPQATTEQLRMACMIDRKSEDASDVRKKVLELMEMTRRTEEEVCSALHDTDNDLESACNLLFEDSRRLQGEWQTSEKKKKKPPAPAGNGEADPPGRDPRSRSGPRPRRGEGEGGGRGRGAARGRGGARAGRGARGSRRAPPLRDDQQGSNNLDSFPTTEDWDNEEWSGSLSDTKVVFIASSTVQNTAPDSDPSAAQEDWDTPETNGPTESHIPTYTYHNPTHVMPPSAGQIPAPPEPVPPQEPYPTTMHQPMGMSGSLSAAQTQYLSQLTQQSQRHDNSVYTSNYGVYGSELATQRKPQRARVPPPSKIPSSAVEMPAVAETSAVFLDVQFGALEDSLQDTLAPTSQSQPSTPAENTQAPSHEPHTDSQPTATYASNTMINETLSNVESTPSQQTIAPEPTVSTSTSLEKQLTATMKQLSVSSHTSYTQQHVSTKPVVQQAPPTQPQPSSQPAATQPAQQSTQQSAQQSAQQSSQQAAQQSSQQSAQNVYHHPPVYPSVYAAHAQQVNSTNAPMTGATHAAYPSSVALTHYQPIINSYQTSSSAGVYGGSALYTAAPYTAYHHKQQPKENTQVNYDSSVVANNSLASTSTTQTSTAKVATTTASSHNATNPNAASSSASQQYAPALYNSSQYYDDHGMRPTLPHVLTGGYYEVGYGVGGARDGTFGLSATDRFARTDAASPQQVPAALPPGYAYFYQPPPTTYQYGVYPTYGTGSNVGGVSGATAGKVSTYQQPPYDAQDSYKQAAGPYTASSNKTAQGATPDLNTAMYAKTHVALNKLNSYDKASFHGGTPPPFGAHSHVYLPPVHHLPHHHQHQQMDVRANSSHSRRESAGSGGRSATANKPAASKPTYSQSYWPN